MSRAAQLRMCFLSFSPPCTSHLAPFAPPPHPPAALLPCPRALSPITSQGLRRGPLAAALATWQRFAVFTASAEAARRAEAALEKVAAQLKEAQGALKEEAARREAEWKQGQAAVADLRTWDYDRSEERRDPKY